MEHFDYIISVRPDNGIIPKPHPHRIRACLELLGVKDNEAMYIGNGVEDVQAAKSAVRLDVAIHRNEYNFNGTLKPTLKIDSLYDLRRFIL